LKTVRKTLSYAYTTIFILFFKSGKSLFWANRNPFITPLLGYIMKTRKFTILHSNDIHGDFLAEVRGEEGSLIGGLALLSGYINKVRREEENVLYVIAGDMVQGSMIDAEYKGISTMEIMNYLAPDVVCLGNHEFDYGLPHLLFLEKMAHFPIVNANLYIKGHNRLMKPYHIINKAGFDIMFIGVITEKIMDSLSKDHLISSFVTLEEASHEIGNITGAYKNDDIDLTILLTHIGFDSDIELAKMLKPEWGIDMIIGGHSHTVLDKPACINNILIAQAGVGSDQIGRFDITVDDDTNSIVEYKWQLVPIKEGIAEPDKYLTEFIDSFKKKVDDKYGSILTKFSFKLLHQQREVETALGNLLADIVAEVAECDIALVGSGAIRTKELGPVVTLGDFRKCFPYDDTITKFHINGAQVKNIFSRFMRSENRNGEGECYQINKGVRAVYNNKNNLLESFEINGVPIKDSDTFSICIFGYHLANCKEYLGMSEAELKQMKGGKIITTSGQGLFEEYLTQHQNMKSEVEGRLVYI